jgi:hypothetical protein
MKELIIITIIIIIIIILKQVVVVVNVNCIVFMASSTFQYWIMVLFWRVYPKKNPQKKSKIKKDFEISFTKKFVLWWK